MLSTFICMLFYIKIFHYLSFRLDNINLNHFYIVANIRFNLTYPNDSGYFQFSSSISKVINIFVHILLVSFLWGLPKWDCLIKDQYSISVFPQTQIDFKRDNIYFVLTRYKNAYFPMFSPALDSCLHKFCHSDGKEKCCFIFLLIYTFFQQCA